MTAIAYRNTKAGGALRYMSTAGGTSAPGTTMTGSGTFTGGGATGTAAGSAPGTTMTGSGSFTGGGATGTSNGGSAPGTTMSGGGSVTGNGGTGSANAPGTSMSGGGTVAGGGASTYLPPLLVNPRMVYVAGRTANFPPMRVNAVEVLTIDFGPILADGETILSASWTNSVSDGIDPNPSAMMLPRETVSGSKASVLAAAHVAGVTYAPVCTVQTSADQTLIQPDYGTGLLYVSE